MVRDFEALHAYVASHMRTPFAWGSHDCVLFAAGAVLAMTGRDPLQGYRGRWTSERGAIRLLRGLGGVEAAVDGALMKTYPSMAQRGDVAGLYGSDPILRLAIVEGDTLVGPGLHGLERVPRSAMLCAWSAT